MMLHDVPTLQGGSRFFRRLVNPNESMTLLCKGIICTIVYALVLLCET